MHHKNLNHNYRASLVKISSLVWYGNVDIFNERKLLLEPLKVVKVIKKKFGNSFILHELLEDIQYCPILSSLAQCCPVFLVIAQMDSSSFKIDKSSMIYHSIWLLIHIDTVSTNIVRYLPILLDVVCYCKISTNIFEYCHILYHIVSYFQTFLDYSQMIVIIKYHSYPVFRDLGILLQFTKVNVQLSFAHKAVISSLSEVNIESKYFFYKSCSVFHAIWEYPIKSESWHLASEHSFCHSKLNIESKNLLLQNVLGLVCYFKKWYKKWKFNCHLVTQQ